MSVITHVSKLTLYVQSVDSHLVFAAVLSTRLRV